jgi:hypothetical protein
MWVCYIEGGTHKLRLFQNRVLRKIFMPQRKDVIGDWRGLHNEFHDLYSLPSISWVIRSRRMRWVRHVMCVREMRNAYGLGRQWHIWEDNKVDLKVIVWEGMEWFYLAQGRDKWWAVVKMGLNLWVA